MYRIVGFSTVYTVRVTVRRTLPEFLLGIPHRLHSIWIVQDFSSQTDTNWHSNTSTQPFIRTREDDTDRTTNLPCITREAAYCAVFGGREMSVLTSMLNTALRLVSV